MNYKELSKVADSATQIKDSTEDWESEVYEL